MKIKTLLLLLLFSITTAAQQQYDLLYLQGDLEQIQLRSAKFSDSDDYYWNALVSYEKGEVLAAIATLEAGLAIHTGVEKLECLLAKYYTEAGQYTLATPLLQKNSDRKDIFLLYIKSLVFAESYPLVIDRLAERLQQDSLNATYFKILGESYYHSDSLEEAIKCFEQALIINPKDQVVANKLVSLYLKHKEYKKAISVCNSMLLVDESNKKFVKLRAMANFNLPDFDAAIDDFSYLLNQGDSSRFVIKHLGISELSASRYVDGRKHLKCAYRMDSTDYETSFYLGKAYLNSQYPEKGLFYLNHTLELLKSDPKIVAAVYIEKQSIYSTLLDYEKALECYKMAYKYKAKPEYLFYIASSYENLIKDKKQALLYYEQFLEVLPQNSKESQDEWSKQEQITVSLKDVAEQRIVKLKEELFFEGSLKVD